MDCTQQLIVNILLYKQHMYSFCREVLQQKLALS